MVLSADLDTLLFHANSAASLAIKVLKVGDVEIVSTARLAFVKVVIGLYGEPSGSSSVNIRFGSGLILNLVNSILSAFAPALAPFVGLIMSFV